VQRPVLRRGRIAVLALALTPLWPTAAAASDPRLSVPVAELRAALECPPSFAHRDRNPVLLVHGTAITPEESWDWNYAKSLPAAGYDVCTVRLPDRALGDIQVSSEYLVYAIRRIRAASGRKLTVIGHSQGGIEPRWAVRWWRSARGDVEDLVGLASPNHGIVAADLCVSSGNCWPAVWQIATGSHFLTALGSPDETPGAVSYTNLYSATDELVEPSTTVPLGGGANTANVRVQDLCPGRPVHHVGMIEDAVVYELVIDAMTHPGPAEPARVGAAACAKGLAPGVSPVGAIGGNAAVYGNGARAFSQHPGTTEEPPLAPYARGG
jgi:triacylglycerol lipase